MTTILFALLTALANAIAVTTQHIASTSDREKRSMWNLMRYLIRRPLWLLGWVALAGSLVFQALALHAGPLSEVQPLLVTELVLALVLRRGFLGQSIRPVTWLAAIVSTGGLAVFLAATSPAESAVTPLHMAWSAPIFVSGLVVGVLIVSARRGTPGQRAALFATATAILWALEATFIKATTDTFTRYGWRGTLTHWEFYGFVVAGVLGLLCEQAALHVGPLNISQLCIVVVDPLVSVALGLWLYHERLRGGVVHVTVGAAAFALMSVGIVGLIRTAPPTMRSDVARG